MRGGGENFRLPLDSPSWSRNFRRLNPPSAEPRVDLCIPISSYLSRYGFEHLSVTSYEAKIKTSNSKSLAMFSKLRFEEVSRSEVFQEVTLKRKVDAEWKEFVMKETTAMRKSEYVHTDEST